MHGLLFKPLNLVWNRGFTSARAIGIRLQWLGADWE